MVVRARARHGHTRLISRNRIDTTGYKAKQWLGYSVMEPGSWVMERKMLLTIKELAEDLAHATPAAAPEPDDGQSQTASA